VREELEPFLARAREAGAPVPRFVERELRAYLDCGVLAHGFLRVHCDACGHDRLVSFSCKGRGLCPSCGGRRMADTAAHLVDRVLPEVPVRQWVLTLPYPLRYRCAWDARLTGAVLRAFLRALFADYRRRARRHHGVRRGLCGAVTFLQRFGSALNLTPHFHTLLLDGVYAGPSHTPELFLPLPPPTTEDVARVLAGTARRILRALARRALTDEQDDPLPRDEPLLAALTAASLRSRIATGPEAGRPWHRLGDRVEPAPEDGGEVDRGAALPPRCVRHGGMSLHADVAVPARDRRRLERLCRYVARPPLALERLEALPDGRLAYRLKTRWRDGTTHVVMERRELLERLAPLIPPPRAHQVRYHGVLAPCASGRDRVVPAAGSSHSSAPLPETEHAGTVGVRPVSPGPGTAPVSAPAGALLSEPDPAVAGPEERQPTARLASREDPDASREEGEGIAPSCSEPWGSTRSQRRRTPWAELLQRVFELDALRCPACGQRMRVLAAITDPQVARRILECLDLPARAPPLAPAPVETGAPELDAQEVPCELDFDLPTACVWDEEG